MNNQTILSNVTLIFAVLVFSTALSQDQSNAVMISPDSSTIENSGAFIFNADDRQGKDWMTLSPANRASYVCGFLAGLDHVYNSAGFILTFRRSLSVKDLADHIYRNLMEQTELLTSPLDEIILTSLNDVLFISLLSEDHQLIHFKGAHKPWTKNATLTFISHHQKEK